MRMNGDLKIHARLPLLKSVQNYAAFLFNLAFNFHLYITDWHIYIPAPCSHGFVYRDNATKSILQILGKIISI